MQILKRASGFLGMGILLACVFMVFIFLLGGFNGHNYVEKHFFYGIDFIGNMSCPTGLHADNCDEGFNDITRIITIPVSLFLIFGAYSFFASLIYDSTSGNLGTYFQFENKFRKKLIIFGSLIILVALILAINSKTYI
jgi:hypothetical protein